MELGFTPEELSRAFNGAMKASIEMVKARQAGETDVFMDELPSEQLLRQQLADQMADLSVEQLFDIFIMASLMVIDLNNKRITQQLKPFLKNKPGKETE